MDTYNLDTLSRLVTPSILLSLFVLLTSFFGKIVLREIPFKEDTKTGRSIMGMLFLSGYFIIQLIIWAVLTGDYWDFIKNGDGYWIVVLLIVNFISSVHAEKEIKLFNKEQNKKRIFVVMLEIFLLSIIFSYIPILFFVEGKFDYLSVSLVLLLSQLMTNAEIFFLWSGDIIFANIYFINDKKKSIKNCRIIRDSKEDIIIQRKDKTIILNRNIVSKIEILDAGKKN